MKNMYDVQQLLKQYGVFIYLGDRSADLEMMQEEVRELYQTGLISPPDFQKSMLILRSELSKENNK
ncbi:MAG: YqgQ family protein [Bacillota bacterium]